ncbi:uncharacterized protein [Venturia canescens]|uniref:uncharacterized protein n=1 Tax=Venturia canescens TaxID=32260 RepID=UPI001C9D0940|nr:uncharacterized protein LOC122411882 [Venturia canescens]XP_043288193.1 uncharacterized protein LOC122418184 [Venturia canescens]XP_043289600.1 uncharacterized protein LOC122419252 [Venturia canescens]
MPNKRIWTMANPDANIAYCEDADFIYMRITRDDYAGPVENVWAVPFMKRLHEVWRRRAICRLSVLKLWREDAISKDFDAWSLEHMPGDLLGLRRLFSMSPFPGLVEDVSWDHLWAQLGPQWYDDVANVR